MARTFRESRPFGVVLQDYLPFPHLTALDSAAPAPLPGAHKAESRTVAAEWLTRVGLADHAVAKPGHLPGGQSQRVARALATNPRLDARAQLRRHLAEFSGVALLVTHDPLDARAPADRLVVIEEGRVVLEGTASDIARHARTPNGLHRPAGRPQRVQGPGGRPHRPPGRGPAITATEILSGPAFAAFPPSAVTLFRDPPPGSSARNPPISPRSSRPNRPAPDRHGLGESQGDSDMRIPGITPHWGYGGPGHEALNHPPPARRSP